MKIDENGIPNTISNDRARPAPTDDHAMTRAPLSHVLSARAAVLHITDAKCKEPPDYVVAGVNDHHLTSKDLVYKVHRNGYARKEHC